VTDDEGSRVPGPRHASGKSAPALGALVPSPGAHRARRHRVRRRLLWSIPVVALIALAVVLLVPGGDPDGPTAGTGDDDAAWADLVRWADAELPEDATLLVPADVAPEDGEERFRPLDADEPQGLLVVTAEPPPGSTVLARFEGDPALTVVDVRAGQPTGDELERRRRLSAAILANPNTGATGRAADVLEAADVDARLLGLLAVLVAQLDIGIGDFPPAAGEPADGPPARAVLIDSVGGVPVAPGDAATERLLAFLDAQLFPFAPDDVEVTDDGALVHFRYESAPDAVVTESTP
jgi:hypothetical protein